MLIPCTDLGRLLRKGFLGPHCGAVRLLSLRLFFLFPLLKIFERPLHGSRLKGPLFDTIETIFNFFCGFVFEASPVAKKLSPAGFENFQCFRRHSGRKSQKRIGFKEPVLCPELAREFPRFSDFLRERIFGKCNPCLSLRLSDLAPEDFQGFLLAIRILALPVASERKLPQFLLQRRKAFLILFELQRKLLRFFGLFDQKRGLREKRFIGRTRLHFLKKPCLFLLRLSFRFLKRPGFPFGQKEPPLGTLQALLSFITSQLKDFDRFVHRFDLFEFGLSLLKPVAGILFSFLRFPQGFGEDLSPTFGFQSFGSKRGGFLPVKRGLLKRLLPDADQLRRFRCASCVGRAHSLTPKPFALSPEAFELLLRTRLPRTRFKKGFRPGNVELQFLKGFGAGRHLRFCILKIRFGRTAILFGQNLNASRALLKESLLFLFFGHALEDPLADQGIDFGPGDFFEDFRTIAVVCAQQLRKSTLSEHRASCKGLQIHAENALERQFPLALLLSNDFAVNRIRGREADELHLVARDFAGALHAPRPARPIDGAEGLKGHLSARLIGVLREHHAGVVLFGRLGALLHAGRRAVKRERHRIKDGGLAASRGPADRKNAALAECRRTKVDFMHAAQRIHILDSQFQESHSPSSSALFSPCASFSRTFAFFSRSRISARSSASRKSGVRASRSSSDTALASSTDRKTPSGEMSSRLFTGPASPVPSRRSFGLTAERLTPASPAERPSSETRSPASMGSPS